MRGMSGTVLQKTKDIRENEITKLTLKNTIQDKDLEEINPLAVLVDVMLRWWYNEA